jgi:DNA (cytosine-5)-methyltransferase 1
MMQLNFIDLFAGAGGFSEGFVRAGFRPLAHVDMDASACATLRTRVAFHELRSSKKGMQLYERYLRNEISQAQLYSEVNQDALSQVIHAQISWDTMGDIFKRIDELVAWRKVHVIVGGPPCQAYSVVGRARDPQRMQNDRRNYLYQYYGEVLRRYQPEFFVFENVLGLLSAGNRSYFEEMQALFKYCGYSLDYKVLNAADFGVLQERKRVILVGKRMSTTFEFAWPNPTENSFRVGIDLFADLPFLKAGEATSVLPYAGRPTKYLKQSGIRNGISFVSQHITRPHHPRDLEIYRIAALRLQNEGNRLKYSELPENLRSHQNQEDFSDRFKVVNPFGKSHTLVAHISKDGHHFIHPDPEQNRSISVREAARIQSFPDDYFFEGGRTAAFKQIGNAVPPFLAEAIAKALREYFKD